MVFKWDEAKAEANEKRHGVSFSEARKLFDREDDLIEWFDGHYPPGEDRFKAIGPVGDGLLVVIFTERQEDTIRIISARAATPREIRNDVKHRRRIDP